jgi:AcrR family transcriptional regulator
VAAPRTARAVARAELTRAILDRASAQLGEVGPAALSVRQVARELEMASSAVYRYFPSRDELLTALLVRAFDAMGEAVEQGAAAADPDWARAHPHEYALAYGSPVPGYVAPTDTVAAATRVPAALLAVMRDAQLAGRPLGATGRPVGEAERAAVAPISAFTDPPLEPERTVRAVAVWATLFGHVSLELFGHTQNAVLDHDVHFAALVDQLADDVGV